MPNTPIRRTFPIPVLLLLLLLGACGDQDLPTAAEVQADSPTAESWAFHSPGSVKVLSRNMYLGGDVGTVFAADLGNPAEVAAVATALWGQIQSTNFPERAKALAREIKQARPHVVGIQEIPRFLVLNQAFQPVELHDNLSILQAEIEGLPYTLAAVQENTVAVMPVILETGLHYVQYTDRIAVLVRNDVEVEEIDQGHFQAHYLLAPTIDMVRGWIRVSGKVEGARYHFVNTHLEGQAFAPVQAGQTQELVEVVTAGLEGPVILMGDLNSDAEGAPGGPSYTPTYETLIAAGFQDSWDAARPGGHALGLTCCQDADLTNRRSILDERIDFVLVKGISLGSGHGMFDMTVRVNLLGTRPWERTYPSRLWPSDHAGLLATLKAGDFAFNKF